MGGRTQAELAHPAGVTQSAVSAHESGFRQPSLPTVQKIITPNGYELDLILRPARPPR